MASSRFLLQGLSETDDHLAAVQQLLEIPHIEQCLISVAFMNSSIARFLANHLATVRDQMSLFVGIRNGITSKQALEELFSINIFPTCVDTATQSYIFHPKVYLALNQTHGKLIVGSANFTTGGLIKNIEASLLTDLDLAIPDDVALATSIFDAFHQLSNEHPQNVFATTAMTDLNLMTAQGLLENEANTTYRATTRAGNAETRTEQIPRMLLRTRRIQVVRRPRHFEPAPVPTTARIETTILLVNNYQLLWTSKSLSRRDLSIPTGAGTNPTGSMYLNRGNPMQQIDFQHYFRDEVFAAANWTFDVGTATAHYERAYIRFNIIIKGIDHGIHELKLSNNTNINSATYRQRNGMTQIHWGDVVKSMIAHEDLLNGIMCIYAPDPNSDVYTLTFDIE